MYEYYEKETGQRHETKFSVDYKEAVASDFYVSSIEEADKPAPVAKPEPIKRGPKPKIKPEEE